MMKTKKSSKGLALVLAAVLALTPMAGFPLTALATGDTAAPNAEAPAGDADAPQVEAPATDVDANPDTAGSATKSPAASAVTPDPAATPAPLAATPTVDPAAAGDVPISAENFPDDIFRECVRENFDKNDNQTLDTDEIKAATYLNVSECEIASLQGIKYLTALTSLDCRYNNLTALDVSHNTALTGLFCGHNKLITDLDVSHNTALTTLDCHNTALTDLNVSHNTALTTLDCGDTRLADLDVSHNTALTGLFCDTAYFTTLDVSHNPALTELWCFENQLTTLDLTKNPALKNLRCNNNRLTALDLAGLNKLGKESWDVILSPQAPQIPVVKRGAQYELDIEALAKGQTLTAITLDGADIPDLATYKKKRDTAPASLQYTCETGASGSYGKTMAVEAAGFDYSYLATLDAGTNGTLTFDGTPSASGEVLLAEKSEPTFTVAPASGYQVATLTVNGNDATGSLVGKTLTLPPVTDAVTIAVTFEKIPAPPTPTPIVNYYSVTPTVENGTITPEHLTTVREGNSLKYTFSPKEGYALESVSVNGAPVEATEDSIATTTTTTNKKTYSHTINSIYSNTTIHVSFKAVEPPVDPPKPPVDPTDPVDPPKPPVDPAGPINPLTPPVVPDNGGNNGGGTTTIVERTNTVFVPAAPQAAALVAPETPATPATAATAAAKTEAAPAKATADTATPQDQPENPALGAQAFDMQHSHIPLALLLLAVWLVGGFAVIRQRKHTHDAIEGTSY